MKAIKLKPLNQKPLYSQFYWIFGENYNWNHDRLDRESKPGFVIDTETGQEYELCTEAEEQAYLERKKRVLKALEERAAKRYDNHPNPIIDFNNPERWKQGLEIAKNDMSKAVEMCEDSFWHFLECVPPKAQGSNSFVCGEPYSHNNKGQGIYLCGIKLGNKYYAQYGTVEQYNKRELFKNVA